LILMAAPAVLGDLRKSLNADLSKIVITEIPKDVIGQGEDKIRSQLKRALALS
jgi:protein required for attachment to host cells